ncbi:MAG: Maf family nucleotide pyrophosphatase [Algoriphagus sp.]|jgi:septum formation protein|uniref:Maf family nucleotide pyrophosphatase n=1 Tax=Algoriphagus sp. TaxID=1872435 RepID=UPI00277275D1|nr:Maf family nucleotide pyrophosphatase [Algoriphagus sp.]MDP4747728.1 Maf family nucleotide pyrophosphatase [Algoriphagus sp.]MDP4903453.1 Maf family nucleotide pyrophosphatase [Algoriphagus sp.]MDP5125955.1 Maf family nucleotide pyrophosphatase [Algoriphagus sp.]
MPSFLANLASKKIILGSNSPRRQELLRGLELDFEVRVHPIEEDIPTDLPAQYAAAYLSKLKADAFLALQENELLITADTVVIDGDKVLGKPMDEEEAFEMLKRLSGATHTVITAVTLKDKKYSITLEDEAKVTFRHLDQEEIRHYLKYYQPYDKAGAYGIQEWIGFVGVSSITGSYFTVMGFPLHLVYAQLKKWG